MKTQPFVRRYSNRSLIFILLASIITMIPYKSFSQDIYSTQVDSKEKRLQDWEEPRHQLVFSRDSFKIMDIRIPPGDTTEFHLHQYAAIGVIINHASTGSQKYGEDWPPPKPMVSPQARAWARGYIHGAKKQIEVKENYHRVCNNDTVTFHYVAIISARKPKGIASDAFQDHENYWYRAQQVVVEAKQESEKLQFPNEVIVIQYLKGESDILENNVAHSTKTEAGAFSCHEKNTAFTIRNKGEGNLGFVLVEIK